MSKDILSEGRDCIIETVWSLSRTGLKLFLVRFKARANLIKVAKIIYNQTAYYKTVP
jgi:hypothetical protein